MPAMNGKMKNDDKTTKCMAMYTMHKGMDMHTDDDDDDDDMNEAIEKRLQTVDVAEHVDALVEGESDLSEEFKRKGATVFEAAVKSKIRDEVQLD